MKAKYMLLLTLIAILTSAVMLANLSSVNAADVTTYAYISVEPNPVGVNQQVLVNVWIEPLQPTGTDRFHNLTVTITKPDGTIETVGPLTTSTVGSQFFTYTPTMVGNYSFKLTYAGEVFTRGGYYYLPSQSPTVTLRVQQEPILPWQDTPLPTDYWTRPIYGQNRLWASIVGDWLMSGYNATGKTFDAQFGFNPYSQAPRSAHIMWTQPLAMGGIVGGDLGDQTFYAGLSYESKGSPAIIMNGRLYYNIRPSSSFMQGFVCVDLRTGEELWRNTNWNYSITLGQEYEYTTGNQGGVAGAYLWQTGTTYRMFDAFTGNLILTFANASSGTNVLDKHGNWYVYVYSGVGRWLAMWNFTRAIEKNGLITFNPSGEGMYRPTPRGGNPENPYDWLAGIQWNQTDLPAINMTLPDVAPNGTITGYTTLYPSVWGVTGNTLLAQVGTSAMIYYEIGYSLTDGRQLWVQPRNTTTPSVWGSTGDGKYIRVFLDRRVQICYDAATGNQLWVSEPMDFPWGTYGSQFGTVAYNKFYWGSYDGHEYAFDLNTGKIVWKFYSGDAGYETPYGTYPFWYGPVIADGIVFAGTGEHSPTQPLIRGEKLFAIDAETGKGLWNISGLMVTRSIADGYLITYNAYDNQMYCFGKGPSATTVSIKNDVVTKGNSVLIQGTVTDQSAGAKQLVQQGKLSIVPAIADEDQGPWMEYLYMQQPMPKNAKGVTVSLTATREDGTVIPIGEVVSDMSGKYACKWTPPDVGLYKITATFKGSYSYGSSYDVTYLAVEPAPSPSPSTQPSLSPSPTQSLSPSPAPPPTAAPPTNLYLIAGAAAVIIIVAAAIILKKRRKQP